MGNPRQLAANLKGVVHLLRMSPTQQLREEPYLGYPHYFYTTFAVIHCQISKIFHAVNSAVHKVI